MVGFPILCSHGNAGLDYRQLDNIRLGDLVLNLHVEQKYQVYQVLYKEVKWVGEEIPRFSKTTVFTRPHNISGNIRHKPPPPYPPGKIRKFIKVFLKSENFPPQHSWRQIRKTLFQREEREKNKPPNQKKKSAEGRGERKGLQNPASGSCLLSYVQV